MKRKFFVILLSLSMLLPILNSYTLVFAVPNQYENLILRHETIVPRPIDYGMEDKNIIPQKNPFDIISLVVYLEGAASLETDNTQKLQQAKNIRAFFKSQILRLGGNIVFEYSVLFNGLNIEVEYQHLETIYSLPYVLGISSVYFAELHTDYKYGYSNGYDGGYGYEQYNDGRLPNERNFDNTNIVLTANGIYDMSNLNYQGQGMVIAIIDSGVSPNHSVFQNDPPMARFSDISFITPEIYTQLHATRNIPFTNIHNLFRSRKIPFDFDYTHNRVGAWTPDVSNHGTHVAGIAAGHSAAFRGVAPYAQILAMKVQTDERNIPMSAVYAAMEDAVIIGADIINVSIGAASGFSTSNQGDLIINRAIEQGVNFYFSAGNSYFSGHNNYARGTLSSNPDTGMIASPSSLFGVMSVANASIQGTAFAGSSSFGPGPNLSLKPDISGPGLSVRSAWGQGATGFSWQTGTSMSSPNVAGGALTLLQSIRANPNYNHKSDQEIGIFINRLLMSTAKAMINIEGIHFTPRRQGSGFADIVSAINHRSIIYAYPDGPSKLELGHDPDMTGIFEMQFIIQNLTDSARSYNLDMTVQTSAYSYSEFGYMMELRPVLLDANFVFSTSNQQDINRVVVPANSSVTVKALVNLTDQAKNLINIFENGFFVEGFILADSVYQYNGDTQNISIPYLGFFGDWTAAPAFDATAYDWDTRQAQNMSSDDLGLWARFNQNTPIQFMGGYMTHDMAPDFFESQPAYIQRRLMPNREYIAIGYTDAFDHAMSINTFRATTLRNILDYYVELVDPIMGTQIFSNRIDDDLLNITKTYHRYGMLPFGLPVGVAPWQLRNNINTLNSNTILQLNIKGALDFGDMQTKVLESFPVYIDFEAPIVLNVQSVSEGANLYLDVCTFDNHFARVIRLYRRQGGELVSLADFGTPIISFYKGQAVTTRVQISQSMLDDLNGGRLYIYVEDFARNGTTYSIENIQKATMSSIFSQNNFAKTLDNDFDLGYNVACNIVPMCLMSETVSPFSADFAYNGGIYLPIYSGYMLMGTDSSNLQGILRIKQGTTRINQSAFINAQHLTEVIFPESVKRIGSDAFRGTRDLLNFTFEGDTPPLLEVLYDRYSTDNNPYWHFNNRFDFHRDRLPGLRAMTLRTQKGIEFNNWIYTTYFDNRIEDKDRTISFVVNGQTIASFSGNSFDRLNPSLIPADPSADTPFIGWALNGNIISLIDTPIYFVDINLVAQFEAPPPSSHAVTLIVGGQVLETIIIDRGDMLNLTDIIRPYISGYAFKGWYLDSGFEFEFLGFEVDSDFNLYARHELLPELNRFRVRKVLFPNEGVANDGAIIVYVYEGDRIEFDTYQRDGYRFLGWYLDDGFNRRFDENTIIERDIVLYARWQRESNCAACGAIGWGDAVMTGLAVTFMSGVVTAVVMFKKKRGRQ